MPIATVSSGNRFRTAPAGVPAAQTSCPSCGAVYVMGYAHVCAERTTNRGAAGLRDGLGSRQEVQDELDDIAAAMRGFHLKPADLVMRECSAYSARLSELTVLLNRAEGTDRQYLRLRTQQVLIYLAEMERQWKTASRLLEVTRQEIALSGGQV